MRFSARERVGLRAMVELAQRYGAGPVPLSEVAAAQEVSLSYLEQVIGPLRRAGLLTSTRGASGGYTLARPPAAITVGDVIRVLEGAIVPIRCVTDQTCSPPCALEDRCATRSVWEIVRDRLTETLDGITLADL
ncbi:MAG: Rrf2 family transcriptional regulator [Anaerolineae bacterium]|nr:Rrf2 family transcriptional regulator [Anaerolineae bacterium]